jgi:hypothetical protein
MSQATSTDRGRDRTKLVSRTTVLASVMGVIEGHIRDMTSMPYHGSSYSLAWGKGSTLLARHG